MKKNRPCLIRILRPLALAMALATLSPAFAGETDPPNAGRWGFRIFKDAWALGPSTVFTDRGVVQIIIISDLAIEGAGVDNAASSYKICNNTGGKEEYQVQLYDDKDTKTLLEDTTFTVEYGTCVVRNISDAANDKTSSFIVGRSSLVPD